MLCKIMTNSLPYLSRAAELACRFILLYKQQFVNVWLFVKIQINYHFGDKFKLGNLIITLFLQISNICFAISQLGIAYRYTTNDVGFIISLFQVSYSELESKKTRVNYSSFFCPKERNNFYLDILI